MINFGYNCLPDQKEQKQLSEQQNSEKYFSFSLPKLSPSDFILLFISFILFCISGMPLPLVSTAATILAAPLYAVFSHKTGNVFRLSAPISAFIITFIGNIIVFKNFAGSTRSSSFGRNGFCNIYICLQKSRMLQNLGCYWLYDCLYSVHCRIISCSLGAGCYFFKDHI